MTRMHRKLLNLVLFSALFILAACGSLNPEEQKLLGVWVNVTTGDYPTVMSFNEDRKISVHDHYEDEDMNWSADGHQLSLSRLSHTNLDYHFKGDTLVLDSIPLRYGQQYHRKFVKLTKPDVDKNAQQIFSILVSKPWNTTQDSTEVFEFRKDSSVFRRWNWPREVYSGILDWKLESIGDNFLVHTYERIHESYWGQTFQILKIQENEIETRDIQSGDKKTFYARPQVDRLGIKKQLYGEWRVVKFDTLMFANWEELGEPVEKWYDGNLEHTFNSNGFHEFRLDDIYPYIHKIWDISKDGKTIMIKDIRDTIPTKYYYILSLNDSILDLYTHEYSHLTYAGFVDIMNLQKLKKVVH